MRTRLKSTQTLLRLPPTMLAQIEMAKKPQHHGRTKHALRDPSALQRWMDARARHRPWMPNTRAARTPYKTAALRALHAMTVVCGRCGYLVPWVSAKTQASRRSRRTGQLQMREGDGCTGRCKKAGCKRALYAACQYVWAHELMRETRILVARPRTVEDRSVWKEPQEVARAVATRVLQRYGKAALVGRAREAAETWEARLESGTV